MIETNLLTIPKNQYNIQTYLKQKGIFEMLKKLGRKAAGIWGRPRKHYNKQQSSKAIRRYFKTFVY